MNEISVFEATSAAATGNPSDDDTINRKQQIQIQARNFNIEIKHTTDKSIFLKFFCCNFTANDTLMSLENNNDDSRHSKSQSFSSKNINIASRTKNLYRRFVNSKYLNILFYRNNLAYVSFILIYLILQIILVIIQLLYYIKNNNAVLVARACGVLISFNMGFVIILISRRLTTWLRSTKFGLKCLPLDEFIEFHKMIGVFILILSIGHTIAHCINLYWLSREFELVTRIVSTASFHNSTFISKKESYANLLFTTKSHVGWFYHSAIPTGWVILALMILMEFFSISCIRKKGHFQLFYYTHWLYLPIYVVTILHAKNYWKWFIVPAVVLCFERVLRLIRTKSSDYGNTYIRGVNLLPSKVTQLIITRPQNFKFKPGDYVFVSIPEIAYHEWHPFTISSAPELNEELWLHIRSLGNWTNKLHQHFYEYSKFNRQNAIYRTQKKILDFFKGPKVTSDFPNIVTLNYSELENSNSFSSSLNDIPLEDKRAKLSAKESIASVSKVKLNLEISNEIKDVWCDIRIDGPYGTASRRIFHAEHAVLIAGGIGVTPFASILQSLVIKYKKTLKKCPTCTHEWYDSFEEKKLKKVDFIWVNRDHKSFEWFINLLADLEVQQEKSTVDRFLNIRLYMTSASNKNEIKLNAVKTSSESSTQEKRSLERKLLELYENIQPGRPDLEKLFQEISMAKKGRVETFFCGGNTFGKCVQRKCEKYKFKFSHEYF